MGPVPVGTALDGSALEGSAVEGAVVPGVCPGVRSYTVWPVVGTSPHQYAVLLLEAPTEGRRTSYVQVHSPPMPQ